jgi:aminopeptidase-like protein
MIGTEIHKFASSLWHINRSITGIGVRETLSRIKSIISDIEINEVPSGSKVFDWMVPKEWKVNDAFIISPSGEKICSFKENNLHLVGYSTPIHTKLSLNELQANLYSLPEQPTAIPYITSYYKVVL